MEAEGTNADNSDENAEYDDAGAEIDAEYGEKPPKEVKSPSFITLEEAVRREGGGEERMVL